MTQAVKVRKKNRILHVESDRLAGFLNQGYDQIDEDGNVVKRATGGRTVSLPEFNKVVDENDKLKSKVKELEAASKKAEAPKK